MCPSRLVPAAEALGPIRNRVVLFPKTSQHGPVSSSSQPGRGQKPWQEAAACTPCHCTPCRCTPISMHPVSLQPHDNTPRVTAPLCPCSPCRCSPVTMHPLSLHPLSPHPHVTTPPVTASLCRCTPHRSLRHSLQSTGDTALSGQENHFCPDSGYEQVSTSSVCPKNPREKGMAGLRQPWRARASC